MRHVVAWTLLLLTIVSSTAPAAAAVRSPRPTAALVGTGTVTTEDGEEAYIEVSARDADGIITEIEVRWGDRSVTFAHSYPCLIPPTPDAGSPHRFLISHRYADPGTYTVRYVVRSISGCDGTPSEQHSRPYVVRLRAP